MFERGDRVRVRGTNWIGHVHHIIRTPPPRWEEEGAERVEYNIFFIIGGQRNVVEGELLAESGERKDFS